ncbi:MAG: hypothetical protein DMF87_00610 [Acidobacteria bacterium]|nr:MAG: hypothetical protein DMF87_00610 [Acidobacteriota bacterium]
MIKVDIVNEVSKIADITKVKAEVAVDAVFDAMRVSMQRGDRIELRGFVVCPYGLASRISRHRFLGVTSDLRAAAGGHSADAVVSTAPRTALALYRPLCADDPDDDAGRRHALHQLHVWVQRQHSTHPADQSVHSRSLVQPLDPRDPWMPRARSLLRLPLLQR